MRWGGGIFYVLCRSHPSAALAESAGSDLQTETPPDHILASAGSPEDGSLWLDNKRNNQEEKARW